MCVTFVYFCAEGEDSPFKLVVINNRDEQLDRPTSTLAWENAILAGRDEKDPARGTWLGVNKRGDVGNLLSITQKAAQLNANAQRTIPSEFLNSSQTAYDFCSAQSKKATQFNGFQFLGLNRNEKGLYELCSLTNLLVDAVKPTQWPAGAYGFGNSPRTSSFRKVLRGEELFKSALDIILQQKLEPKEAIPVLLDVLTDTQKCCPDEQLAFQTGHPESVYAFFTSVFVTSGHRYGTRSHSIFIVDKNDNATFYEKRMTSTTKEGTQGDWSESTETFSLNPVF
ncbi:hypothetical protein QR680_005059 [Steinernema hermaphroditum]|uniref:Transport and Golgi organization protein 2 homolog n=1 Tax=Steinernema hermaphroditum TaxID=289476 RepID=A0AA39HRS5_9BILA|nr:hypothetical protein QR680_005059 [Steinernema hermaphroditum]